MDPYVTVTVKEYHKRFVTVLGEVNRPGTVDFPSEQTLDLATAISTAGGFTKVANKNKIQITRGGKQLTYNLSDLLRSGAEGESKQILMEPGDVIYVPQSFF